jgi:hypothetical protein
MKNITALTAAGLLAAGSLLAGCSPTTENPSTATGQSTPTVWTGSPAPAHSGEEGHGGGSGHQAAPPVPESATLHDYIVENKIAEVPFKKGDPGAPTVDFPLPPGWTPAGDQKPDWAYGAIFYDKMKALNESTYMYAIASKLTGKVDPQKIMDLAPGQLDALPGFKAINKPERVKFGGYDSVNYVGTYESDGKTVSVGQQTVVIPGKDALFVLQLNGAAPEGQEQVVIDAADVIRAQTKIILPS